ncbi:MAG: IS3 family transposase [Caldilineaceae bacterium]
MIYALMDSVRQEYPVNRLCRLLGVAPSGYYHYCQQGMSEHDRQDVRLVNEMRRIHFETYETYGSPRMHAALRQAGIRVGRKRVERLMREHGLRPHMVTRSRGLTQRAQGRTAAPNRLQQNFVAQRPNQVWLTDSTEFDTAEGKVFVAVVEDLFSRRIVGWNAGPHFDTALVINALKNAIGRRSIRPDHPAPILHHSDQGSQYTSHAYLAELHRYHIEVSMSSTGNCYDNAPVESFFATLKKEWTHNRVYLTRKDLLLDLHDFLEVFYNRTRLHSSLAYRSPVAFEEAFAAGEFVSISQDDVLPLPTQPLQ